MPRNTNGDHGASPRQQDRHVEPDRPAVVVLVRGEALEVFADEEAVEIGGAVRRHHRGEPGDARPRGRRPRPASRDASSDPASPRSSASTTCAPSGRAGRRSSAAGPRRPGPWSAGPGPSTRPMRPATSRVRWWRPRGVRRSTLSAGSEDRPAAAAASAGRAARDAGTWTGSAGTA